MESVSQAAQIPGIEDQGAVAEAIPTYAVEDETGYQAGIRMKYYAGDTIRAKNRIVHAQYEIDQQAAIGSVDRAKSQDMVSPGNRIRCGVVWCGVVWCGVVWCGVVW